MARSSQLTCRIFPQLTMRMVSSWSDLRMQSSFRPPLLDPKHINVAVSNHVLTETQTVSGLGDHVVLFFSFPYPSTRL